MSAHIHRAFVMTYTGGRGCRVLLITGGGNCRRSKAFPDHDTASTFALSALDRPIADVESQLEPVKGRKAGRTVCECVGE